MVRDGVFAVGLALVDYGRTIRIFDETIEENTSHGNGTTREVRVVVQALTDGDTSRRIDVTSEQRVNVVLKTKSLKCKL